MRCYNYAEDMGDEPTKQKKYLLLREHNELMAQIWGDKVYWMLSWEQMENSFNLSIPKMRMMYTHAGRILKNPERYDKRKWVTGLQGKAKYILLKTEITSFVEFYNAVNSGKLKIGALEDVGVKTEYAITTWMNKRAKELKLI